MPAPAHFIRHEGKQVLVIDFQNCGPDELRRRVELVKQVIAGEPPSSVRTLTLVHGATFNAEINPVLKDYARHNSAYVMRAAIVGATGLRLVLLHSVRLFSGRDIRPFGDAEQAKRWLVE